MFLERSWTPLESSRSWTASTNSSAPSNLDPDKIEVLLVGGSIGPGIEMPCVLSGDALPLEEWVNCLGLLDLELLLDEQMATMARITCYQLWAKERSCHSSTCPDNICDIFCEGLALKSVGSPNCYRMLWLELRPEWAIKTISLQSCPTYATSQFVSEPNSRCQY